MNLRTNHKHDSQNCISHFCLRLLRTIYQTLMLQHHNILKLEYAPYFQQLMLKLKFLKQLFY